MSHGPRILQVVAPGPVGGLERVVQLLVRGFHRRNREIHLVAIQDPSGAGEEFLEPLSRIGVPIYRLRAHPRNYAAELRFVRHVSRTTSADVVHTHGSRVDVLDGTMARLLGYPTVTTVHGSSRLGGRSAFYEWLQDRSYRRFSGVVAVSEPLQRELIAKVKVDAGRVHLIPNAWPDDIEFEQRAAAREALGICDELGPVIGWVGRLIPIKGADVFLKALGSLHAVPWRAIIVGDGPERSRLEELASALGLAERVTFAGTIVHAARFNRAFDLFVLSSRSEGTPIAVLEAMAAGVPVVASAVGGVPDLLDGGAGLTVPPENPEALGGAIRQLLVHPSKRSALSENAKRRTASEYGAELFLDRYDALYHHLTAHR